MPNYFKIKNQGIIYINGTTIEGDGEKGLGNAAEQFVSNILEVPVEDVNEITKEEYKRLESN